MNTIAHPHNRNSRSSDRPDTGAEIVQGNHNFVIFFYVLDVVTKTTRFSESYTTMKTYSSKQNTAAEALEKATIFAQNKQQDKSHFLVGFQICAVNLSQMVNVAPEGVTAADAASATIRHYHPKQ